MKIVWLLIITLCTLISTVVQADTVPGAPSANPSSITTTTTTTNTTNTANTANSANATNTASTANPGAATNQFQQWLQSNGYSGQNAAPPEGPPPPESAAPAEPEEAPPPPPPPSPAVRAYIRNQQAILDALPPNSPPPSPDSIIAFDAMMQKNLPLTPGQVVQLHQQIDMSQRAAAIPAVIPPKPVSTTLMVNLAPGTTPPAIRLAQGYVSTLLFVDSTGAPWPIASYDIGDPKAMNIQWDGKGNLIFMQAVSAYSDGDMVIKLAGLDTPITLELITGQPVVDYRVDIHVSGFGPNTKELPIGTNLPASANELLLGVLDGVAPAGSKELTIDGADCEAWLLGNKLYLRTRLTVLSPGWTGKMVSPDGMMAYELPQTSSILVSRYGEPVELKVEGF